MGFMNVTKKRAIVKWEICEVIQKEWFAKPKCTLNIRMKKHKN
tara:strand:+ start:2791 stop:2919 length:129 start_codon:yes stop_codon:yes gene_type:complete